MPALTLDSLKSAMRLKAHAVPVPEFGEGQEAWLAELSADERDERLEVPWNAYKERIGQEHNAGLRAFLVAACWCNGPERTFIAEGSAAIEEVAKQLGECDSRPVTRMFFKAQQINGIGDEQVEELEKN